MQPETFATEGFAVVPGVLSAHECEALATKVSPGSSPSGGTRCLLAQPWCNALAARLRAHPALSALIPSEAVAVQCTYFEKSAARNWLVPMHRDLSIPVAERVDHPALQGWSEKEGALFVQPPAAFLEQLVAVRLHLDPCMAEDGPLRVVPGSHVGGFTLEPAMPQRSGRREATCEAGRGWALAMRPLLLHASSKATGNSLRRVLHFVFGPPALPYGLRWQHAA
jgi:hypothetical protein